MKKQFAIGILTTLMNFFQLLSYNLQRHKKLQLTSAPADTAAHVQVGVWLVNVEKVDLPSNSYRLDFYLWFSFNPSQMTLDEVRNFEFINGQPTKYEVDANQTTGYLEYRVKGDFITNFDFTKYPFESHDLPVELEHKSLPLSSLVYDVDTEGSAVEPAANVAGWNLGGFNISVAEHSYGSETFSRFVFSVTLQRPMTSAFRQERASSLSNNRHFSPCLLHGSHELCPTNNFGRYNSVSRDHVPFVAPQRNPANRVLDLRRPNYDFCLRDLPFQHSRFSSNNEVC